MHESNERPIVQSYLQTFTKKRRPVLERCRLIKACKTYSLIQAPLFAPVASALIEALQVHHSFAPSLLWPESFAASSYIAPVRFMSAFSCFILSLSYRLSPQAFINTLMDCSFRCFQFQPFSRQFVRLQNTTEISVCLRHRRRKKRQLWVLSFRFTLSCAHCNQNKMNLAIY